MKTKTLLPLFLCLLILGLAVGDTTAVGPVGSGFTYQGELQDGDGPVTGQCGFKFSLWDASEDGNRLGQEQTVSDVEIEQGRFTVLLNGNDQFGIDAFDGGARWLQIQVRCGSESNYVLLSPRQQLTAAPYAAYSHHGLWSGLMGIPDGFADDVDDDTLAALNCGAGDPAEWNGLKWVCGYDDVTPSGGDGDITAVYAGNGLGGGGESGEVILNADPAYLQRRVSGSCATGSSIRVINQDGSVSCEVDDSGGSEHDHLMEIWTGNDSGLSIEGSFPSGSLTLSNSIGPGLKIESAETVGVLVSNTAGDGIRVGDAEKNGVLIIRTKGNGFNVYGADGDGVTIGTAGNTGVSVGVVGDVMYPESSSEKNGFEVAGAEGHGLFIGSAGKNGIYINTSVEDGIVIDQFGKTTSYTSDERNGIEILGVSGNGLFIGSADAHGVQVRRAENDGFNIYRAGNASYMKTSDGGNGFEVAGAGGDGLFVGHADENGVFINSATVNGVRVEDAGWGGISVGNAGTYGIHVHGSGSDAMYVHTAGQDGLHVNSASRYAGWFGGNLKVTGSCSGCLITEFGINVGKTSLEAGDIVMVTGITAGGKEGEALIMQVSAAGAGDTAIGVVQGGAEMESYNEEGTMGQPESKQRLVPVEGTAQPGDYLTIAIFGPTQVKASAADGLITAGSRLAVDDNGLARALQTTEVNGIQVAESAPTVGIALDQPTADGLVWVLVNPQ